MNYQNFKLTKRPVFEDNPELLSVPEFEKLKERQIRYVMLVDWFKSPLRLMKLEARKEKAAVMAGYKMEKDGKRLDMNGRNLIAGKVNTVEAARRLLREIQHDEESELFEAINVQIEEIVSFLKTPEKTPQQLDKAVTLMSKLPTILETKQKLLGILDFREKEKPEDEIVVEDNILAETEEYETSILDEYMDEEENN